MPIVTLKEILADAQKQHYGVGMFDVHNLEMTNAVLEAAEEMHSPIIIALAEVHADTVKTLEDISNIMVYAAKRSKVPVCVHLDHGGHLETCIRVMHYGFSSVMFDGSMLPYEENVRRTSEVVHMASIFGASVEAELGHVGGAEGGGDDGHQVAYTDPDQAQDYVKQTGVDALAVSIGTAHGVYKEAPKLDLNRLRAIRAKVDVPLVLHGGSGLTDLDFRNCIQGGIAKVNIYTELVQQAVNRIRCEVAAPHSESCKVCSTPQNQQELVEWLTAIVQPMITGKGTIQYPDLMRQSMDGMKQMVCERIKLFGSVGKA